MSALGRGLGLCLAGAVLLGGLWFGAMRSAAPAAAEPVKHVASGSADVSALDREVRALRRELEDTRRQVRESAEERARPEAEVPPAEERAPRTSPPTAEEKRAYGEELRQRKTTRFDAELTGQVADRAWYNQTKAQIDADISHKASRSVLSQLECGATLCRAALVHPDEREYRDAASLLAGVEYGEIYGFGTALPDHQFSTVVYFSRQGSDLPSDS